MEIPVVVGVDGSETGLRAVDWAVAESLRLGLPLRMVYASLWERYEGGGPPDPERPSEQVLADHIVSAAMEHARRLAPEIRASSLIRPQDAVTALLEEARSATMVVVGSRGRGGLAGLLLGSVSLSLAGRSHCPVVVVRTARTGPATEPHGVVVGVGGAAESGQALRFAFREAETRRSPLVAVRAWRSPMHRPMGNPLFTGDPEAAHRRQATDILDDALAGFERSHPDVEVRRETVEGSAHHALLTAAATAELLVVGARRLSGHGGLQLGRVNHAVLHHAPCPVAVVPERM
ncbi:universal stress protein [Streptomyces netropsis]|uniref:universal stress protein n=1 Tax=Streptomyces netropsis TaxID=55404 RepID=UPI0037B394A1